MTENTRQGKVKTTVEFYREKFADEEEETQLDLIDPKGGSANGGREAES